MTIEESNDLNKMGMYELIGGLLTYKMKRKPKKKKTKSKRDIALKLENEKRDFLMDDEDVSLLAIKFNKFPSGSKGKTL